MVFSEQEQTPFDAFFPDNSNVPWGQSVLKRNEALQKVSYFSAYVTFFEKIFKLRLSVTRELNRYEKCVCSK